jgi:hypothetical protein
MGRRTKDQNHRRREAGNRWGKKEAREKKQAGSRSCWHVWRGFVSYFDAENKMRTMATSSFMNGNMNLHRFEPLARLIFQVHAGTVTSNI